VHEGLITAYQTCREKDPNGDDCPYVERWLHIDFFAKKPGAPSKNLRCNRSKDKVPSCQEQRVLKVSCRQDVLVKHDYSDGKGHPIGDIHPGRKDI